MNTIGTFPPQEGVENLLAARKLLSGKILTPSDINQAILYAHGAVEKLFRSYLAQHDFIPPEIRGNVDDAHRTHFPELIDAMSEYGRPPLSPFKSQALAFNRTRNPIAHAMDDGQRSDATSSVAFAEKMYGDYARMTFPNTALNQDSMSLANTQYKMNRSQPMHIANPFIKESQKAHWLTKYSSDEISQSVWVNGSHARVPGKGRIRCPIREFGTVVTVWLHETQLRMDLSGTRFFSADNLEVQVQVELTAKINPSELAIISVVTRFEESLSLVQSEIVPVVQAFCKSRSAASLPGGEIELATLISKHFKSTALNLPIELFKAVVQFNIPLVEKSSHEKVATAISYEQAEAKLKYETSLSKIADALSLQELSAHLQREKARLDADCAKELAEAETQTSADMIRLKYLTEISKLTDQSKTAMLHIAPEIFKDIELGKKSQGSGERDKAMADVFAVFKSLVDVTRNNVPPASSPRDDRPSNQ